MRGIPILFYRQEGSNTYLGSESQDLFFMQITLGYGAHRSVRRHLQWLTQE